MTDPAPDRDHAPVDASTDATSDSAPDSGPDTATTTSTHPVLVYTGLRFAILVGVGALLYLVGLRGLLLFVFAFLISGIVSIFALNRTREGAAWGITSGVKRLNERIDAGARAEDATDEDDLAQYDSEHTAGVERTASRAITENLENLENLESTESTESAESTENLESTESTDDDAGRG